MPKAPSFYKHRYLIAYDPVGFDILLHIFVLQADLIQAQLSGLEGIELAAALSHLSSQPARLSREAALAAAYDMHDSTQATLQPSHSLDSQHPAVDTEDSGRLCSDAHSHPATVHLTFDANQRQVHALTRPSTAPSTGQKPAHLQAHYSLPNQHLTGGPAPAVNDSDSTNINPELERVGSSVSLAADTMALLQSTTSSLVPQPLMATVASGSFSIEPLAATRSLPLTVGGIGALRRPVSAPTGSRVLPPVPENGPGAMHEPSLPYPAAPDVNHSLLDSSRSASEVVGSELSYFAGQERQPWQQPPGIEQAAHYSILLTSAPAVVHAQGAFFDNCSAAYPVAGEYSSRSAVNAFNAICRPPTENQLQQYSERCL